MNHLSVFNKEIFNSSNLNALSKTFDTARPFRYVIIDNFLDEKFANEIESSFPSLKEMKKNYNGLNEKKSEDSNFSHLPECFTVLRNALSEQNFASCVESITSIKNTQTLNDRLGSGLHQGGNESFLDIHIDYNLHPIHHLYRKLNLIIFFNKQWENAWGGNLEFWDRDVKNRVQSISPIFNRCVIFECSDISYHGYNQIKVPENITRKSMYQYYFTEPPEKLIFHDTIFKPRPEESLFKRISTPIKEQIKNVSKRLLLKVNAKKFLK